MKDMGIENLLTSIELGIRSFKQKIVNEYASLSDKERLEIKTWIISKDMELINLLKELFEQEQDEFATL